MITSKKIHFISIGGSIMHSLAINLKLNGNMVTGSDDKIYDPSKSQLKKYKLYPKFIGYRKKNISKNLDFVIVGMHTKKNNIELLEAKKQKLKILSFPEFIRKFSQNKQRIIIAGSHGKSTITSIIMHVLKFANKDFDYLVGAKVNGFDFNIKLSDSPIIIIEGDEYLSSPLDKRPKFLNYDHHIVLVNGISWDHANVFPTLDIYLDQFKKLINKTSKGGSIIIYDGDHNIDKIIINPEEGKSIIKYNIHKNTIKNDKTYLISDNKKIPIKIFGDHNMQNISGALKVIKELGVTENKFYQAIKSYSTPKIRLEKLKKLKNGIVFRDFAHSPSKVLSTVKAVKKQFKNKLSCVLELHTLSSLNEKFLKNYKNSLNDSDRAILYFSNKKIIAKFSEKKMKKIFNNDDLICCNTLDNLKKHLKVIFTKKNNILLMSSGNFDNLEINKFFSFVKN